MLNFPLYFQIHDDFNGVKKVLLWSKGANESNCNITQKGWLLLVLTYTYLTVFYHITCIVFPMC